MEKVRPKPSDGHGFVPSAYYGICKVCGGKSVDHSRWAAPKINFTNSSKQKDPS